MPIPVPNAFETASFAANLPAANSAFLPRLLYNTISLSESICFKKLSPNFRYQVMRILEMEVSQIMKEVLSQIQLLVQGHLAC